MLDFKVTSYLEKLAKKSRIIHQEFYPSILENTKTSRRNDPLEEDRHMPVFGLIHKYPNRVLILLTLNCAAYCRFCTRRRSVSDIKKGQIGLSDLKRMATYIKKHPKINEVILSGGDPFTVPEILFSALKVFGSLKQIKIIRIGTRLPVSLPLSVDNNLLNILKNSHRKPLYILINFEHPDELTKETSLALKKLREGGCILLSQTVFLKGINDDVSVLAKLFTNLVSLGVKPYYIFHNDEPKGTKHFTVSFKKEALLMDSLRKKVGGLACPVYVLDTAKAPYKIPLAYGSWQTKVQSVS
ncbi:MAG: lysine 2,3-aminomutase [Candidatus Parcubacteria bacterium]|nr:lysine 2,3-aminomutase [Candidatus Parcubacteria bacterium]